MAQSPKKRIGFKKLGKTHKNQVKFNKRIEENQKVIFNLEKEI